MSENVHCIFRVQAMRFHKEPVIIPALNFDSFHIENIF